VITTRELDPSEDLDAWYAVYRAGASADREAAILIGQETLLFSVRTPGPLQKRHLVGAFDGERVVGAMLFQYRLQENLKTVEVEIDVPPAERRRGIATALWGWARAKAASGHRSIFRCEYAGANSPGAAFASSLGFTVEHVEDHLVVPQRDIPTGGLTNDPKPWDVDLLRTIEERVDKLYLSVLTLAISTDGRPAGYTVIYLPRTDPDTAQQLDTLVLREFRGRDLGAHLKLANLQHLAAHRTTQTLLHTFTAKSNTPIQKLNTRFGFHPVEENNICELKV
jgi:GNAT superfamily N-acetyltransferase